MRRGIAADAPLSDAGEERLSEEDRRALKMIEELFPGEYRAAKREVAAAIASDAPSSLGGLAAILSQRGNPDGAVLAGKGRMQTGVAGNEEGLGDGDVR